MPCLLCLDTSLYHVFCLGTLCHAHFAISSCPFCFDTCHVHLVLTYHCHAPFGLTHYVMPHVMPLLSCQMSCPLLSCQMSCPLLSCHISCPFCLDTCHAPFALPHVMPLLSCQMSCPLLSCHMSCPFCLATCHAPFVLPHVMPLLP